MSALGVKELADNLADYIATRDPKAWPADPAERERETVHETVRLIFSEALPDALDVLKAITLAGRS